MEIIAIQECADGNSTIGTMWLETGIFNEDTPLNEVISWANEFNCAKGKLILRVVKEKP